LGKAVLLEGFRRLRKLGAKKAVVYCYEDNLAFYQSAGFEEFNQWRGFSKLL
jgi:ribosomal protein S18 acetylase RimI-like enzyme